jgi:hypothetical protein
MDSAQLHASSSVDDGDGPPDEDHLIPARMRGSLFAKAAGGGAEDSGAGKRRTSAGDQFCESLATRAQGRGSPFDFSKFLSQFLVNALFPLSAPVVLFQGGVVRLQNQNFWPRRRHQSFWAVFHWVQALAFFAVAYINFFVPDVDFVENVENGGKIKLVGEAGRHHSMVLLALILGIGRWSMVAVKYAYLADDEYTLILTNRNHVQQAQDMMRLQVSCHPCKIRHSPLDCHCNSAVNRQFGYRHRLPISLRCVCAAADQLGRTDHS